MKNRPLFSGCLIGILLIYLCVVTGGAKFFDRFHPSVLEKNINEKSIVRLSGQVYDLDIKENYQIIYLKNSSIYYQNKSFKESKIIIYDEKKLNIRIGNHLKVSGEISFYEEERNPGNFNQKLYYQKQGIHASVWAQEIRMENDMINKFYQDLYDFRMQWKQLLYDILGEEKGAVLSAMLLAEKSGMSEETKELYQANGISHILAISGLHLSVIGAGLYKIFRQSSGSFLIGGMAGISFLSIYILMIGMSVSVLRALIMFLFRVGADMAGRHYDRLTALVFSAFFTLLWNPLYLFDGGFWLSYGAVLAMICVFPMFENLLFQGFWVSVSINVVTLPVLLYCFYEVPIYSVFLNMIIVPFMTVILICGMAGSLCCSIFSADGIFGIDGLGSLLLEICGLILSGYEKICELSVRLPGARIVTGQPQIWQIVAYYVVLLMVVGMWWGLRCENNTIKFLYGALVLNVLMIAVPVDNVRYHVNGEINVTILDVGQGDGIFIRGPKGNTYLIDCGSSDVKKVGKYRMESFLKSQGVGKIDYVFVSHGDGDHVNGIQEMLDRMSIGVVIETIMFPDKDAWSVELMEVAELAGVKEICVTQMNAGQVFMEGDMKISCLAPVIATGESNADSMVLALSYKDFDVLFTGDVEAEGENRLIEILKSEYSGIKWDVLKVSHHGSKNSTSEDFLNIVNPTYALISAGRDNSYGHPHNETLKRLSDAGSTILSTQDNGAITIVTDGKKMKLSGYVKE